MQRSVSDTVDALLIARMYFTEGATKIEIASRTGLSRFKVARVLDQCIAEGLVEIVYHPPDDTLDYALSTDLKRRFGLRHALVVPDVAGSTDMLLEKLGWATALLLRDISQPEDVLGFAWTRTLEVLTQHIAGLRVRAVVQLCGAFPGASDARTSVEIVRDVARSGGGSAHLYYAPLIASDPAAARAIRRQPDVQAAQAMVPQVTKAVVTIGGWTEQQSTVWAAVPPGLRADAKAAGAVAEICGGIFLDADGRPVPTPLRDLAIGITAEELAHIPDIIGLAFGVLKAEAALAAIRGKLVTSLVTHAGLARILLSARAA